MQKTKSNNDFFKIFVDQLKEGVATHSKENIGPEFLATDEKDLSFEGRVSVDVEYYVAHGELIIHFNLKATCIQPCSMCNGRVEVPITVEDAYQAVPLDEIKGGIYDFSPLIREELLLAVPHFVECKKGQCPNRQEFSKYLKDPDLEGPSDEGYRPFKDL